MMVSPGFLILLFLPLCGMFWADRKARRKSFGLVLSLLIPPFIGELVFFFFAFRVAGRPFNLADPSILMSLIYFYPFALVPLGLWAPFVGLLAWLALEKFAIERPRGIVKPVLIGFVLGALVGAAFLAGFYGFLRLLGSTREIIARWAVVGAASGAAGGVIVALFFWWGGGAGSAGSIAARRHRRVSQSPSGL